MLVADSCDTSERLSRLEKQNQELQESLKKTETASDYDLKSRCSREAKTWFNENWSADKNTLLLTFNDHYNKPQNKCFILVENHRKNLYSADDSWVNTVAIYDVQENNKFAEITVYHNAVSKPQFHIEEIVTECTVTAKDCKTFDEFYALSRGYMND